MTISTQIEDTFRAEHGRVLAALISRLGDFTLAEDALQDALVNALERWAVDGIPRNPGAWLVTVAGRRAVDRLRRAQTRERHSIPLDLPDSEERIAASVDAFAAEDQPEMNDDFPDERLKLMFTCCHPTLALEAQVALTLHTLGGLSTVEVARAFLVPVPTMAQRLARARSKIRNTGVPYRVPPAHLLPERLDALLAVIYLIFNEGYVASGGETLTRADLCAEAIRLCRVLVELLPDSAEARGLLALMLLHDSRREARMDAAGNLVLLDEQDRTRWNHAKIAEGVAILTDALRMHRPGAYQLQAAISALHAEAATPAETDWEQIAALYGKLAELMPSPVVEVNRAVAVAMAHSPIAGLNLLARIEGLEKFYPYHAARADLLRRLNRRDEAAAAYDQALALCPNPAESAHLQRRREEMEIRAD